MKKVLLIGKINEIIRSLNECLVDDFQVQICPEEIENVKGMLKIIKPDLVIVNQIGIDELDTAILGWLKKQHSYLPVIFIAVWEEWEKYKAYCEGKQFDHLFRPVGKKELLEKCHKMLNLEITNPVVSDVSEVQVLKKILIVDDSPLLLRNMKSILEEKYTVFIATSGEQAIKFIPNKQPDLILLDYEMPGLDGKETYEMLKANEDMKDIPVIFLTSMSDKEHIYSALQTRPAGYILKPPDRERLFESIEEALKK